MPAESFPRAFGRYTLLANLAQGGMGALYLACQGEPGMEKLCVIKTVLPHLADKEYVARFRDEAKVVVRLSHGNLVPVFDAGTARVDGADELYLAMEHVDGKDLRAVWNRCAKKGIAFPVDVAVYIARELARGLHHAHSSSAISLVHRDVSPPNVLLSFFGEVKLTDFGLAASTMKTEKTAPGVIYGKVSYMSPEQARGEPLDGRTDLYAVAVILWELLTGKQLFPQSEPNLIARVRDPKLDAPSQHAHRVVPALDAIVMKALERDRDARYADCEAFRAALAEHLAQTAPTTDNARVAAFLAQLFGDEIADERAARQKLVEGMHALRQIAANEKAAQKNVPTQQKTAELADRTPPSGGIIGAYLDGRYLVKRLIGEGGMGLVYEAEHVEIGRRVAVKILHAIYTRQGEVVARFRSEARAATRIGHPHIIDVFDSGTTVDGAVYFVMEYLDGSDLAELIGKTGPLTVQRTIAIAREICQALAAAHKAGIVHRDMKPENVFLVTRDGRQDFVKVLDFGIAKTMESSDKVGRLTNPGMAMGTPEYMAPEQAAHGVADERVDIYAVGAILYEMLTGRPPHEGSNILEILTRKATEKPKEPSALRPDVPPELERLVLRALAMDPALRPQSMDALAQELGRLGGPAPSSVSVPIVVESPRARRRYVVAGLGSGVGLIAITAFIVLRLNATARPPAAPPAPPPVAALPSANSEPPVALPAPAPAPVPAPVEPPQKSSPAAVAPPSHHHASAAPSSAVPKPSKPSAPDDDKAARLADARRSVAEGRAALGASRFGDAELAFSHADATGFERGPALTGLAEVKFQRRQFGDAVTIARRAVDAGGGVQARMVLGNSYFKLNRYDEAIAEYRKVLEIDKGHVEAASSLAAAEKRRNGG
ncbi:MAG TPA: protein kinase [Polyangia bacterium]|nr:protein kinase [Polyangia bacterium]